MSHTRVYARRRRRSRGREGEAGEALPDSSRVPWLSPAARSAPLTENGAAQRTRRDAPPVGPGVRASRQHFESLSSELLAVS